MTRKIFRFLFIGFLAFSLCGCSFIIQKGRRSDVQKIEELSRQLDELRQARNTLEESLSKEIQDKQVKLEMLEKGLVITVVGDLLFDSGKAKIRPEAYDVLNKVASVLADEAARFSVGIEGHTDNQPIKHSGWKSNWQLSSERALSVLYYLTEEKSMNPERFSSIGYGEYHPVADNATKEGRQLNRRVEIVILPRLTKERGASQKEPISAPDVKIK